MPAFSRSRTIDEPRYSLFKVGLDRRSEKIIEKGGRNTVDWFVDADGNPIVEEQFDNDENEHRIWNVSGASRKLIFKQETDQPQIGIVGLMPDRESLVVRAFEKGSEFSSLYRMRLSDGKRDGPIFSRDNASVARPLVGIDRVVYGVEYSGFFPEYEFLDSQLTTWVKSIQSALEGTAVHIADWTPAFKNVLIAPGLRVETLGCRLLA
jgi:hypothetical protein